MTPTRRRFIEIVPLAGVALLAACGEKPAPPAVTPAPTAPPAPAPAAAPAAPPAAEPAPTAATSGTATPAGGSLPMVDEKDPTAVSLGYVAEASRADATKFKTYAAGQACSNCSLFGGKAGDASGPCPLFAGRQVSAKGWCSAYVKKAG
jgi:High potential iron-sulfur protein